MTTYKYKGVSPDGARVSGVIKAYDEFEAVSQLRETCSVVTKIEAVPEQKEGGVSFGSHRIKDKELAILCSQFAIILTSGLPIDRCVEMVAAQARSREIQRVLEHVAEDVSGGYSLAQSFTNAGTAFPVTFIETIRAGEQSGTLELCFDRLHKYYDKSAKTHAKLVSTLTYPVLVLIVAAIVFMVIMLFAVPMFTAAFAELGSDLAGCMAADPTFPRLLTEMTGVGERSGNMEQTLTVIGDYFDNEVSVTTQRLLSLMEPVITIALAVITVILLLAVYLPMFTMYGSIA